MKGIFSNGTHGSCCKQTGIPRVGEICAELGDVWGDIREQEFNINSFTAGGGDAPLLFVSKSKIEFKVCNTK